MMQPALAPAQHMLQQASQENSNASEQALREQLLAQVRTPNHQRTHALEDVRGSSPNQHGQHNIDPAIAGSGMMSNSAGESGGDDNSDGKKGGKRELSTSKRAAQNRAAQRAFRQRKEGHIKKLEEQVKDYQMLNESYKAVQAENYQLRDYIISLQSRLIESQGDYPPAPTNIHLDHPPRTAENGMQQQQPPPPPPPHHVPAPTAPMASAAMSQLQASAAQAVADQQQQRRGPYDPRGGHHDVPMQHRTDAQLGLKAEPAPSAPS